MFACQGWLQFCLVIVSICSVPYGFVQGGGSVSSGSGFDLSSRLTLVFGVILPLVAIGLMFGEVLGWKVHGLVLSVVGVSVGGGTNA